MFLYNNVCRRGRDRMVVGFTTCCEFRPRSTLCDKVCQWIATGRWFPASISVSSTNKPNLDCLKSHLHPNCKPYLVWYCTVRPYVPSAISPTFYQKFIVKPFRQPAISLISKTERAHCIRRHSYKNVYSLYNLFEEFEDTKGVIRICILKKNRQRNVQKKKDKRTNNDLQNIHIKIKIE
jgi:hypothetical protein